MGRGLKMAALFFILLVSLWLSSMLYLTEARPLNGLGLPGHDDIAGDIDSVSEELSKGVKETSGLSREKYTRTTREIITDGSGPSPPGEGHH
jgi:hypothetical protein